MSVNKFEARTVIARPRTNSLQHKRNYNEVSTKCIWHKNDIHSKCRPRTKQKLHLLQQKHSTGKHETYTSTDKQHANGTTHTCKYTAHTPWPNHSDRS